MRMSSERSAGAWRRLLTIALLAIVAMAAVVVAGCGDDDKAAGGDTTQAGEKPKGGPLTVWLGGLLAQATPGSPYRKWYDGEIRRFEAEYPGTEVKTVLLNIDGIKQRTQWLTAFGAGEGPDFGMMYPGGAASDFGASLTDLREVAPELMSEFSEQALGYGCLGFDCSDNAPAYVAPLDVSGWVLAYNKEIFEKVGVEAPFESWDDLIAGGEKLKAAGYMPFQMGNRDGYVSDAYLSGMEASFLTPADVAAVAAGEIPLTDDRIVEPLRLWADLYERGLVNENACTLETLASQRDFFAGKAATVATYDYANVGKEMGDKLGIMAWPPIDDAPNPTLGAAIQVGQGWVIPKESSNLPLATALLEHLASAEAQTRQFEIAGIPPANKGASAENAPDEGTKQAAELFQQATILSFNTTLPSRAQILYFKETALALCGKKSPEDAMQAVQDVMERELR
jgi:raffinose/stachyose/melibiose transport system substrate-binding protein